MPTYSISLRLQRITTEYAYVRVPVTSEIIDEEPDGTGYINAEKMEQFALKTAHAENMIWYRETEETNLHPIQKKPEQGESYSPSDNPQT